MRPKVLIIVDKPNWCFERIAKQVIKHLSDKYEFTLLYDADVKRKEKEIICLAETYDAILLFVWASFVRYFRNFPKKNIITIGIYDHLSWKQLKNIFMQIGDIYSFWVGNKELKKEIENLKNIYCYVCEDGVDTELFKPKKFVVGWAGKSQYWNELKGIDLIKSAINELPDVELLCQDAVNNFIPHEQMKEKFYDKIACLICASSCEGTPNPVLEALSCGIPVISTKVGIVPDLPDNIYYEIERNINSIKSAVIKAKEDKDRRRKEILNWDWSIKVKNFDYLLQDVIRGNQKKITMDSKLNLSNEVTVFIITVGDAQNYDECIKSVLSQDCQFNLEIIKNMSPMSRAFQEMINRCKTKYFIQVDEDMILNLDAVRKLYNLIKEGKTAMVAYPLWDIFFQRSRMGIKIYDHDVIKNYPFADDYSCEVTQIERLQKDGHRITTVWKSESNSFNIYENAQCIGEHHRHWTNLTIYENMKRLIEKQRLLKNSRYVEEWYQPLLDRYIKDSNEIDWWGFLGLVVGSFSDLSKAKGEKNYQEYEYIEGYNELRNINFRLHFNEPEILIKKICQIALNKTPEENELLKVLANFGTPTELNLHVTDRCNLDCWHCKRKIEVLKGNDMSVETIQKVLLKYQTIKSVCIAGYGEPLLCKTLYNIIEECIRWEKTIGLITNGILLKDNQKLFNYNLNYISVSIHDVPDRVKDKIKEGIKLFANNNQNIGISFITHKNNYKEIPDIIKLGYELDVKFIHFLNILSYTPDFWDIVITDTDKAVLDEIESFKKQDVSSKVKLWPVPISKTVNPLKCKSPFMSISMNSGGMMWGCRRQTSEKIYAEIQHPFYQEGFTELRGALLTGENLNDKCKTCWGNWYE